MVRAGRLKALWPRWQITGSVAAAMLVAAGAAAMRWPDARWWLLVIAAAVVTGAPLLAKVATDASVRRRSAGQVVRAVLQDTSGIDGRMLPTAATAHLETRAHHAIFDLPYVSRDVETHVRLGVTYVAKCAGTPPDTFRDLGHAAAGGRQAREGVCDARPRRPPFGR